MRDWHCHLLPGLDDGAADPAAALAMAKLLAAAGVREVYCTPHRISGLYATTPEQVRDGVAELQSRIDAGGIALKLWPGMEYYLDEGFPAALEEAQPLGESDRLLVEVSPRGDRRLVQDGIFRIQRKGWVPLIAHPERSRIFAPERSEEGLMSKTIRSLGLMREPAEQVNPFLTELRQAGCLFQGNLGSFAGYYGRAVQLRAVSLLRAGCYDAFGSDGHTAEMLQSCLLAGVAAVGRAAIV